MNAEAWKGFVFGYFVGGITITILYAIVLVIGLMIN